MNLISVIIPCRNGVNYLDQAIDGIKKQNMNVEIIVVDDGSTDNTVELAKERGCNVISIPHSGLSAARNKALEQVKGEYILFQDHDDVMTEHALQTLCTCLEVDSRTEIVQAQLQDFISPELSKNDKYKLSPRPLPYYGLLTGAMLFRRVVFFTAGNFNEQLKTGQGVDFLLRVSQYGFVTKKIPFVSCMRRIHNNNMGRTMQQQENKDYASILRAKVVGSPF